MSRVKGHGVGRPLCVVCVCVCACARLAVQATQACALFAVLCVPCAVQCAACHYVRALAAEENVAN